MDLQGPEENLEKAKAALQTKRAQNHRTGECLHGWFLMMFETASLEILGKPTSVEVWGVTLDDAALRCEGRPELPPAVP